MAFKQRHSSDTLWMLSLAQVPTLGSQEGAFENVRMNYSGDQGQTIRQLISAHVLRRVAMCVLSSPHGRRQHLAVSHEKGKVSLGLLRDREQSWSCWALEGQGMLLEVLGDGEQGMLLELLGC